MQAILNIARVLQSLHYGEHGDCMVALHADILCKHPHVDKAAAVLVFSRMIVWLCS